MSDGYIHYLEMSDDFNLYTQVNVLSGILSMCSFIYVSKISIKLFKKL